MSEKENFKIRFSLIELNKDKVYDYFDIDIPKYVSDVYSSYEETPYLVSKAIFEKMKRRLKK